jgi:hypothetical protein
LIGSGLLVFLPINAAPTGIGTSNGTFWKS